MTPEIEGKLRQFKRLMLSYGDFKHARLVADYILAEKLHAKYPSESYVTLPALNCSMIIAYCRPFSGNDARYEESLYEGERGLYDRFVRAFGVRPADNKGKDMGIANCTLLAAQGDQKGY